MKPNKPQHAGCWQSLAVLINILLLSCCFGPSESSTASLMRIEGSIEVNTFENSLFEWHGTLYLLENIACLYSQHASKWFPAYANSSYVRIRDFHTGTIVANISSTIGYGFITPFPDYQQEQLWLFGSNCNRCQAHQNHRGIQGCMEQRGIVAWKLIMDSKKNSNRDRSTAPLFRHWKRQEIPNTRATYNVQVTAVKSSPMDTTQQSTKHVMMAEPFVFYSNNNEDGNLFQGWSVIPNTTKPEGGIPIGGPCIRHVNGYYYVFTGGHHVELLRTNNFQQWELSHHRPFLQPSHRDALVAPYNGFPAAQESRQFPPMHQDWTKWDWNSNDADIAYYNDSSISDLNNNHKPTFLVWGAGTQGRQPKPPLTVETQCANVVAVTNVSIRALFEAQFKSASASAT
ncbi:expressed unknown protein [Seminavis robusta]|uniref:Uncharacterized protein n=1 Tax=Seminavis robusta TaxID=568900 RepID=A0A9N8DSU3_9STRA|nr:expressed unknown protein [Seminavis robusta]|eukprot:Sro326_g118030.1 n/a (400) ;mRNA; f:19166-20365